MSGVKALKFLENFPACWACVLVLSNPVFDALVREKVLASVRLGRSFAFRVTDRTILLSWSRRGWGRDCTFAFALFLFVFSFFPDHLLF